MGQRSFLKLALVDGWVHREQTFNGENDHYKDGAVLAKRGFLSL